jgi:hypothetical protein
MEIWKSIVEFDRYEVSTLGNVRRGTKLLTPGLDTYGYRQVNLYRDSKRYCRKVYRLVMDAFNPNVDNKPQIDHINRVRADDRLENLRWATASENCRNKEGFDEDMLGIRWFPKNSTYMVRINDQYVGCRKTVDEAKVLRAEALANPDIYCPPEKRDMYGITKYKDMYQIRIMRNKKYVVNAYRKTLEDAKQLRDSVLETISNENS